MPNHFHGILQIVEVPNVGVADLQNGDLIDGGYNDVQREVGQPQRIAPAIRQPRGIASPKTVGDMMDAFKSITTVEYIRGVKTMGWKPFDP